MLKSCIQSVCLLSSLLHCARSPSYTWQHHDVFVHLYTLQYYSSKSCISSSYRQSTTRAPSIKVTMMCMTMMIVQLAMMLTMTAIVCVIPVTAMSHSLFPKVLVPKEIQRSSSMDWMDITSTTIHPRTRFGLYLIRQMTFLSLLYSRYHHHANWTWVHMSLSSCYS